MNKSRDKSFHFSETSNDIWKRFYDNASIPTVDNTSCKVTDNKHVFVDNAFFKDFINEGVIRITNATVDTKVLVSTSSFFKCSSNEKDGGSILMKSSGSFVQYKVCSYESKITGSASN
ncbi:hypothetical protein TVAG_128180 [Trichomonas vaginalis G3]|uniref:Uncharacterized protein n=1 Tax=Trichomonas vaginalis (strain ATCC PRA-98 / G3) TaxID=412133 RepID=A2EBH9_TRIV3|nr:hypothetical protein TVAGG3_0406960 [Trichomonas vaginalis G3]EAY10009.1 hypothetical protein TVAG_128180 [Trichomonas vaginalis G3]KAI5535081.1 hypothetical protein TVAGG3_0406960 [Trichomonas vaginalis G3]|eukprot:XP_001322232.1 hypothetical protein [Trichomonas vaginalis G3]